MNEVVFAMGNGISRFDFLNVLTFTQSETGPTSASKAKHPNPSFTRASHYNYLVANKASVGLTIE